MGKRRKEAAELKKSRAEILKLRNQRNEADRAQPSGKNNRKFAWEYELEMHRKQKSINRFHSFGAVCGILALLLTLLFHWRQVAQLVM